MKTVIAICVLLASFPTRSDGQSEKLLELSRQYVKWFYSGDTDRLWEVCTRECTQDNCDGDKKKLAQSQREFVASYGSEIELLNDEAALTDNGILYTRGARYTKAAKPIPITLGLDREGRVIWLYYYETPPAQAPRSSVDHGVKDLTSSPIMFSLAVLVTLLFITLVIISFMFLRRAMAARRAARWARIMATFGLRPAPSYTEPNTLQSMSGTFRSRSIQAAVRWEMREGILNVLVDLFGGYNVSSTARRPTRRVYYTDCRTFFDPSLLLGLRVETETKTGRAMHSLLKTQGVAIGYPAFDKAFRMQAIDPAQARNILTGRLEGGYSIADILIAARQARSKPTITDTFVTLEFDRIVVDANRMEQALSMVAALGGGLESARLGAPRAGWEQALADGWGRFAQAHGMEFDLQRAEMSGRYAGLYSRVTLSISDGEWQTRFTVLLGALPVTGLRILPEGTGLKLVKMFGVRDVQVGDPAFDDRFLVQGEPEGAVRQMLGPEARQQLLLILAKTPSLGIEGDQLWISVRGMITEGAYLRAALDDATRVAQLLRWASGMPTAQTSMG